jgi:hypothetical protein
LATEFLRGLGNTLRVATADHGVRTFEKQVPCKCPAKTISSSRDEYYFAREL